MKKKHLIAVVCVSIIVILINIIAVSYAFYRATVNGEGTEMVVKTGNMNINFGDSNAIELPNMSPGDHFIKTFTITNTGDSIATYNIYLTDLFNTFQNDELVYSLSGTNGATTVDEAVVPHESGILVYGSVVPGSPQEYTIDIEFLNKEYAQNYNQGASFSSYIHVYSNEYHVIKWNDPKVHFTPSIAPKDTEITASYDLGNIGSFKVNGVLVEGNTFTMPDNDVTISDIEYINVKNVVIVNPDETESDKLVYASLVNINSSQTAFAPGTEVELFTDSKADTSEYESYGVFSNQIDTDGVDKYNVLTFKLNGETVTGNKFIMPNSDVEITDMTLNDKYTVSVVEDIEEGESAHCTVPNESQPYILECNFDGNNGSVYLDENEFYPGDKVLLHSEAAKIQITEIVVHKASGDISYNPQTFTAAFPDNATGDPVIGNGFFMENGNVTVHFKYINNSISCEDLVNYGPMIGLVTSISESEVQNTLCYNLKYGNNVSFVTSVDARIVKQEFSEGGTAEFVSSVSIPVNEIAYVSTYYGPNQNYSNKQYDTYAVMYRVLFEGMFGFDEYTLNIASYEGEGYYAMPNDQISITRTNGEDFPDISVFGLSEDEYEISGDTLTFTMPTNAVSITVN